jgi:hypothetical protein
MGYALRATPIALDVSPRRSPIDEGLEKTPPRVRTDQPTSGRPAEIA